MANIVGGVTSINNPRTNWAQTDAKKADYLKNKPSVANALKGHKTGAVISADDVSPVEHEINVNVNVNVHGKNLFKMPDEITTNDNKVEIKDNSIVITNTASNSRTNTNKTLKELCPSLKDGDTVILTFTSTNTSDDGKYIYLAGEDQKWNNGELKTITEVSLNSTVVVYCDSALNSVTTISNIQIEKRTVVKRCGKNLFANDVSKIEELKWEENNKESIRRGYDISLPVGTYSISARRKPEAGQGDAYIYSCIIHKDGSITIFSYSPVGGETYYDTNFDVIDGDRFYLYNAVGNSLDGTKTVFNAYNIQIELGKKATEFEPYDMVEAVADADGNVKGLTSHAPNMVLITDNNEAVIECEYNRDANKVVTDLETKLNMLIATIGG